MVEKHTRTIAWMVDRIWFCFSLFDILCCGEETRFVECVCPVKMALNRTPSIEVKQWLTAKTTFIKGQL